MTEELNSAKNIWETLSPVDCNKHKRKKGKFDYLPWNFAWATLMEHYPESEFRELPDQIHGDGSVTVHTEMTIEGITRPMWLAVTDFKNESIPNLDVMIFLTLGCAASQRTWLCLVWDSTYIRAKGYPKTSQKQLLLSKQKRLSI
tara:strand:+ start:107 stop:541 length:435 start_codon:yes stop_codon:yes gene_type:complete